MKTLIIYDSIYGNTKKIAQEINNYFGGDSQMIKVADAKIEALKDFSLLIIGSPTHGGRGSEATQKFLASIPNNYLQNIHVAAFDTSMTKVGQNIFLRAIINFFGYASKRILNTLQNKGGQKAGEPISFTVQGKEGPLVEGELARAIKWVKTLN